MRRRESRGDLPWAVAPVPETPTLSKGMDAIQVQDQLDRWYGELDHWLHIWRKRNATFFRRLPRIEEQIRLLIQYAEEYLPERMNIGDGLYFEKRPMLAQYYEVLARCLSAYNDWNKSGEAVQQFKRAMALAPEAGRYWYSYVRHLILKDSIGQALLEINAVELRLIDTEFESIAQQIVNWALAYPEIGFGIRAEILKHCIALSSRARTGVLVQGCPHPRPPGAKWQRTEILRVLWVGMQCSMPVDELCKREGIDEATYYRWRKQFLPPEWGTEPALV